MNHPYIGASTRLRQLTRSLSPLLFLALIAFANATASAAIYAPYFVESRGDYQLSGAFESAGAESRSYDQGSLHLSSSVRAGWDGNIGIRNEVRNDVFYVNGYYARGSIRWYDAIHLSHSSADAELDRHLVLRLDVSYSVAASDPSDPFNSYARSAYVKGAGSSSLGSVGVNGDEDPHALAIGNQASSGTLTYFLPVDNHGWFLYELLAGVIAQRGSANANAYHSMKLFAVTFEDGTTPESQGYTVSFDSGMASPNVIEQVVPEPATLTIWGLGTLGCAVAAWRRKRA